MAFCACFQLGFSLLHFQIMLYSELPFRFLEFLQFLDPTQGGHKRNWAFTNGCGHGNSHGHGHRRGRGHSQSQAMAMAVAMAMATAMVMPCPWPWLWPWANVELVIWTKDQTKFAANVDMFPVPKKGQGSLPAA